jgi:hypothetical protein
MEPKISVCRKGDNVYLKLMGSVGMQTSSDLLHAVKKMVLASLKYSTPGSKVFCSFKARATVNLWDNQGAAGVGLLKH